MMCLRWTALVVFFAMLQVSMVCRAFRVVQCQWSTMGWGVRRRPPSSVTPTPLARLSSSLSSSSSSSSSEQTGTPPGRDPEESYMRLALRHAQHAFREKEVPIGAVIVDGNGTVLATSRNQVEGKKDVTAHAEIDCLRKASQLRNNWRLHDCVLYSTLEPCPMCLGAIQASRIKRVVYAASDVRVGACGSWVDLVGAKHPYHELEVRGGLLHEESSILLKRFFQMRRREAKDFNADGTDENSFKEFIDRGYGIDAMLDSNDDK